FFFQAEDGIRDPLVTGVQTCALPIFPTGLVGEVENPALDRPVVVVPVAPEVVPAGRQPSVRDPAGVGRGAGPGSPGLGGDESARSEERRVGKRGRWQEGRDDREER